MIRVSERAMARPRIGLRLGDMARLLVVWMVSSAALAIADVLLPNMIAETAWTYLAATAVAGLLGLVFRPAVVLIAARTGWIAVIVAGLVGQAMLVYVAILIVPGITPRFWSAFLASWIVAGVGTATAWLASAGTDDSFVASLLRRRVDRSRSPIPRWTVSCSSSWTASPFRSFGGRYRPAGFQPSGAGLPQGTMCSASGRRSCPALRPPVSSAFCTARWPEFRLFAGTTVSWGGC